MINLLGVFPCVLHGQYAAGHGMGIFYVFNINWTFLQGFYFLTYSVEC